MSIETMFASGINLAWMKFGHDLDSFDEHTFTRALDELQAAGGNALRWWLHVNGCKSPVYVDGKVTGQTQVTSLP